MTLEDIISQLSTFDEEQLIRINSEVDAIDEKFRDHLERVETRAEEHEVMSDWNAALHEAEKRLVELIHIVV
jgi:phosphate uptake regulator